MLIVGTFTEVEIDHYILLFNLLNMGLALIKLSLSSTLDVEKASMDFLQVLFQYYSHVEGASQVDVNQVVKILGHRMLDIAIEQNTGCIDQDV